MNRGQPEHHFKYTFNDFQGKEVTVVTNEKTPWVVVFPLGYMLFKTEHEAHQFAQTLVATVCKAHERLVLILN